MSATIPSMPPVVPVLLQRWAHDVVLRAYRARVERARLRDRDEDSAPCLNCGRTCFEREIEDSRGFCPRCFARWTGTSERVVLVPYAVPTGDVENPI